MNGVEYAKKQLEQAFGLVNMCVDGMDDAQFNFNPGGTGNSPSKSAMHIAASIDFFVNGSLKGEAMTWPDVAKRYGLPENSLQVWKFEGQVPVAPIKEYLRDVQKSTLAFVDTLTDADLDREIETQFFGKQTLAFFLQLGANHSVGHAGDIAAVKGMQGLKGLPF